jgi:hypothetical protein
VSLGFEFLGWWISFLLVAWWLSSRNKKRNRFTRDGWNVPVNKVYDASCKSGWHRQTHNGRF